MFAGPAGIGKRLTAVALAQALNCTNQSSVISHQSSVAGPPTGDDRLPIDDGRPTTDDRRLTTDACGRCSACARIARGIHPDVLIVEPGDSGSIKIDQVRDIVDRAPYRPFEGRRRVVIIDEADALVPAAQNALLKTLEEPPPSSVFILVTARPDVLLPTVLLALSAAALPSASADDIAAALVARGHSESEARAVAATADGSLGQALEASAGELVEARDVAAAGARARGGEPGPARRLEGAKDLLAKTGGGGASDREQLAVAPARDGVAAARCRAAGDRRRRPHAGQPGRAARARAADGAYRGERGAARVCAPSIGRSWRSSAMPASRSWPTGWCCSCEHANPPFRSSPSS